MTETEKTTGGQPFEDYVAFLQTIEDPAALDQGVHKSRYTSYPNLVKFLRPRLAKAGLAFMHHREDKVIEKETFRYVVTKILHKSGVCIADSRSIIPQSGSAVQDFEIAAGETWVKRRDLSALCGIASDDSDPNAIDEYEKHDRNKAIMDAQKQILSTVDDQEGLVGFWDDVSESKALNAEQKDTIKSWVKQYAAERGWSSDE